MADSLCLDGLVTPSVRSGAALLRALRYGGALRHDGRQWVSIPPSPPTGWLRILTPGVWPGEVDDADVEWLLERGFVVPQYGERLAVDGHGSAFLAKMDAAARRVGASMSPTKVENLGSVIRDLKRDHPDEDAHVLAQMVAQLILVTVLGEDWFSTHVAAERGVTDFFRNGKVDNTSILVGTLRVISLAEMIFNLQDCDGVENSIRMVRSGQIESGFAELEVGKLLHIHAKPFKFITPLGEAGRDYDLEIDFNGITVCADTKCKLETTVPSTQSVVSTLKRGREQLPSGQPGMLFVKVPQLWANREDDLALGNLLKSATDQFFAAGTGRVVAVNYHSSMVIESQDVAAPVVYLASFVNPRHRFEKQVSWSFFREMDRPPDFWVSLMEACA